MFIACTKPFLNFSKQPLPSQPHSSTQTHHYPTDMPGHSKKMLVSSTNPSKKEENYCGKCPKCNEEAEAAKTELLNQASSSDSSSMKKGNTPKDKKSSASSSISKSKSAISLLGHVCEALSITAGSLSPNKSTGQVFIHAIRHAQVSLFISNFP